MNLNEIKGRRGALVGEMRSVLDEAKGRELNADEETKYQAMEKEFDKLSKDVELEEALAKREAALAAISDRPVAVQPGVNPDDPAPRTKPTAAKNYVSAFWKYLRGSGSDRDVRNALQEGTDSEGGYLVPEEWADAIVAQKGEVNVVRENANVIVTASDRNFPIDTGRAAFDWIAEEAAYDTTSDPSWGQETLKAWKVGGIIKVSDELLQDNAFDLPGYLQKQAVQEFDYREETAFITGDGSSKPLGLEDVTSVGGVSTSGVTLAGTATITTNELIDIFHDLEQRYRQSARWITSDGMAKIIRQVKDSDGQYMWQPGMQAGAPDVLLGRPFHTSDAYTAPATGVRSIVFADLGYYVIVDRLGVAVKRLEELYAVNGQVGFRFTKRVDGRLTLAQAITYGTQA